MRRKKHRLYFDLGFNNCYWCEAPMNYREATIEHVIPQSLGGRHAIENLALACYPCNSDRGSYIRGSAEQPCNERMRPLVDAKVQLKSDQEIGR